MPVDERGLVVSALAASGADAVVVSPSHQYPTGAVMHPSRRAELIAWARRSGGLIVEDDYDAEYRYDGTPIASLQSMAPDHVAYIGTCSKTLAPGMRLGWLIVPDRLAAEQVQQHAITYAQPSALTQAGFVIMLDARRLRPPSAPHPADLPRAAGDPGRRAGRDACPSCASRARRRACT